MVSEWPDGKDADLQLTLTSSSLLLLQRMRLQRLPSTPTKPSKKSEDSLTGDASAAAPVAALLR